MRFAKLTVFALMAWLAAPAQHHYDCKLWGLALNGGSYGWGSIFSYDLADSSLASHYAFTHSMGGGPMGSLFQASDGLFYGTTWEGGTASWNQSGTSCNGCGTFFSFDPATDSFTKLYDFDYDSGPGALPYGGVIEPVPGKLYGVTSTGGSTSGNPVFGALFEYDIITKTMTNKRYFDAAGGYGPQGTLIKASNGLLYGMTFGGGSYNGGTIFSYDLTTGTYSKLYDFDGTTNGNRPQGDLIEIGNGILYGLVPSGGLYNNGVLFSFDINSNAFTKLHDFHYTLGGYSPQGSLLRGDNGKLYGLCSKGGTSSNGTLFEYDINSNVVTHKYSFGYASGKIPLGSLMQSSTGNLYGVTSIGGAASGGTLFEYDPVADTLIKRSDLTVATGYRPRYIRLIERCTLIPETLVVIAPNVFTPNADGINDTWQPVTQYANLLKDMRFSIYNRWGNKVFSGDAHAGWNGTYSGQACAEGTYYYLLDYSDLDGGSYTAKGFLLLTR